MDRYVAMHGGATPRGIASPHFQTGRWSKDFPANLSSCYEEAREAPELLSLRDELALVDLRVALLLDRVGEIPERADAEAVWPGVQNMWPCA